MESLTLQSSTAKVGTETLPAPRSPPLTVGGAASLPELECPVHWTGPGRQILHQVTFALWGGSCFISSSSLIYLKNWEKILFLLAKRHHIS